MILDELKTHLRTSEPVTREFVALMDATFRYYGDTRALFFEKLPHHLLQSELVSLVNVEVKNLLFDERFCQGIQESLKTLRRAIIRLEDLRALHPQHPDTVNNLTKLAALAERVEALYQKHWEYYRYQERITEEDLVGFLVEIDQIGYEWDIYLSGFAAISGLMESLSGRPCPEDMVPLRIAYQRETPQHFAVGGVRSLLAFLEAGYRFICAVSEIDPASRPLTLIQVEVARPVRVELAVPIEAAPTYRKFLQYLFLKDMLKRDALLKVVFEVASREMGRDKPLAGPVLTGFQKELSAALKQLPEDGQFTISDRTFPSDGIRVLQEFTASLDEHNIRYDMLIRGESAKRRKARAAVRPKDDRSPAPAPEPASPLSKQEASLDAPGSLLHPLSGNLSEKEHIGVLTDRRREN